MSYGKVFSQRLMRVLKANSSQQLGNSSRPVSSMAIRNARLGQFTRQQSRLHASGASTVSTVDVQQMKMLLQSRRCLEDRSPYRLLHIRGVTFDNKQDLVKQLERGQPVMLVKEPSNPVDPKAVEIRTLDGHKLGHVSKHITEDFPLQVCFGSVYSVGEGASGNWGALVSCCPSLHGLSLEFLPQSWAEKTDMEKILGSSDWQKLQQRCCAWYRQRCAVSSTTFYPLGSRPQPQVIPRWTFDYNTKTVSLAAFIPVAEPFVHIHQQLATGLDDSTEKQEAVQQFAKLMNWSPSEVEKYVGFAEQQRQEVEQQGWQLADINMELCTSMVGAHADKGDEDEGEYEEDSWTVARREALLYDGSV